MGLFKSKAQEDWKVKYIKEFNEMRDTYEEKLRMKQIEIDNLKKEVEDLKSLKNNLKPKEKQIKDSDNLEIMDLVTEKFQKKLHGVKLQFVEF